MLKETVIHCPICQKEIPVSFYDLLDFATDAMKKEQLYHNTLFSVLCPDCQKAIRLNYDCLCVDSEKQYAIALLIDIDAETETQLNDIYGVRYPTYQKRIVRSQQRLLEKVLILDAKLDDRVIEVMKLIHLMNIQRECPDIVIDAIYFTSQPDYHFVLVKEQKTFSLPFEEALYAEIEKDMPDIESMERFSFIADDWAKHFLDNLAKEEA